jgi:hypothetical protein
VAGGFKPGSLDVADMDADRWATAAGFAGALVVLGALVWLVGLDDVLSSLGSARPAVLAVGLPLAASLSWRHRDRVETAVVAGVTPLVRAFGRAVSGRTPSSRQTVAARVDGFFAAIERVATYWFPTVVGGGVAFALGADRAR